MANRPDADGALTRYLSEIREHPLAGREEEIALARAIRAGDEEALNRLVAANLRFVVAVAKRYAHHGIPLEELVNEGNLGLINAARRYDETRGVRFLSYAVWWIRQSILESLARDGRIVRVPAGRMARARRVSRASGRLSQSLHRFPDPGEVALELGLAEQQVIDVWGLQRSDLSLDAPVSESDEVSLVDFLSIGDSPDHSIDFERQEQARRLAEQVQGLPEREAEILNRYFGLMDHPPETMAEIGQSLGVSRERIRTIKERALARLRLGIASRESRTLDGS